MLRRNVVSYRNSTSNHNSFSILWKIISVVSYRNSTSNHNFTPRIDYSQGVVSYRNSTSNHNGDLDAVTQVLVVSYRNSTSNHNYLVRVFRLALLYLIEILHQTTTLATMFPRVRRCILSKFYIKPQRRASY